MWKVRKPLRGYGLDGYSVNGKYSPTANYGDTITYQPVGPDGVPVTGQIWLAQTVNGQPGYNGPFTVPMAPYVLSPKDQQGDWVSMAYQLVNGQQGSLIEQATLHVGGTIVGSVPGAPPPPSGSVTITPPGPPPITGGPAPVPGTPGGAPANGGGSTFPAAACLSQLIRFILATPPNGFATGSNRSGCSATNTANCDPQQFTDLATAVSYAQKNGEIPYQVLTAQEPWDLISCKIPFDPSRVIGGTGIPWYVWAIGAYVGYRLLK